MADQATVRTNGPSAVRPGAVPAAAGAAPAGSRNGACPADVVSNVTEFGENLLTLGELQARLAVIELNQNVEAAKVGVLVALAGAALALASLPVVLAGVAELLVSELGMKRGYALLSVAVVALAIAGPCIAIAGSHLRRTAVGFPLTREEFTRNLNWVRTVLLYSGRSSRRR
jgi:uncharacterized membrane protein YqjE